jgi:hypothetical protein
VDDSLGLEWTQLEFDDSGWIEGTNAFGFDQKTTPTFADLIASDISAPMRRINASCYSRFSFEVADPSAFGALGLRVRYEDGFIAYLNGVEVARAKAPSPAAWNAAAGGRQSNEEARAAQNFNLTVFRSALRAGRNVLAIHGFNETSSSADYFVQPQLLGLDIGAIQGDRAQWFETPTPGWPNGSGFDEVVPAPVFVTAPGAFVTSASVEISNPAAGAEIRYTIDGKEPTRSSPLYGGPIAVTSTRSIKAKAFLAGRLPSKTVDASYVILNASLENFSSNLPIFIINTFGKTVRGTRIFVDSHVMVFEPDPKTGRASFKDQPHFAGRAGFHDRGSSTFNQTKPNLRMETWDENGQDLDFPLLGLPSDSDWVLHAPFNFDPALIRNPFIFELSNQIGRYATRWKLVEVYLNETAGAVTTAQYFGVYNFLENIKRAPQRVNVERLGPEDRSLPEIQGGWIFKIDRSGDGETSLSGFQVFEPPPEVLSKAPEQSAWFNRYHLDFNRILNSPTFADPVTGYASVIDVDSWIDHHLLNVLAMNVDALRLSGYQFKSRFGKYEMGPIWDFDRSMGSTDGRDSNPLVWKGGGDATDFFNYPRWSKLFSDPNFKGRYEARWRELRRGAFSDANINAVIDLMAGQLSEAAPRNWQRWRNGSSNHATNIATMRSWLLRRTAWIDSQFLTVPILGHKGGMVTAPFELTISDDGTGDEVWYTTDATDPKGSGVSPSAGAQLYSGPITITRNTQVQARIRTKNGLWSGVVIGVYVVELPKIALTEIMYNPVGGTNFEFVEITNFGPEPIPLARARFSSGFTYEFAADAVPLNPGEYVVVARNLADFGSRYDTTGMRVVGPFGGSLGDRSDALVFSGPVGERVFTATYQNTWYPETDAQGRSLVLRDVASSPDTWDSAEAWGASAEINGSPGRPDSGGVPGGYQVPGDGNQDGRLNVTDVFHLLRFLFSGSATLPCGSGGRDETGNLELLDANADAELGVSDAIHTLVYLFQAGPAPAKGTRCARLTGCRDVCQP